ncbi:MAG: STAS domain-containing protein [Planctomycetota bacterium]
MKFFLIAANGPKMGLPISINVDLFLLGSDTMCQLRAKHLGPRQCALVTRHDRVFVRDFSSGEPTMLNGRLLPSGAEWPIRTGDCLEVGHLQFLIHFENNVLATKDVEEWEANCVDFKSERSAHDDDDSDIRPRGTAADAAAQIIGKLNALTGQLTGRLRIGREQGITTVRFNDSVIVEEDEIETIRKELAAHLHRPHLKILIDLKNVDRMSTKAMTMIGDFHRSLQPFGSDLALCRVAPELRAMVQSMQLANLRIFSDVAAAYATKW